MLVWRAAFYSLFVISTIQQWTYRSICSKTSICIVTFNRIFQILQEQEQQQSIRQKRRQQEELTIKQNVFRNRLISIERQGVRVIPIAESESTLNFP